MSTGWQGYCLGPSDQAAGHLHPQTPWPSRGLTGTARSPWRGSPPCSAATAGRSPARAQSLGGPALHRTLETRAHCRAPQAPRDVRFPRMAGSSRAAQAARRPEVTKAPALLASGMRAAARTAHGRTDGAALGLPAPRGLRGHGLRTTHCAQRPGPVPEPLLGGWRPRTPPWPAPRTSHPGTAVYLVGGDGNPRPGSLR